MLGYARLLLSCTLLSLLLQGCGNVSIENTPPPMSRQDIRKKGFGKLLGDDIVLLGKKKEDQPSGGGGLAVNAYLWRSTLSVLSFMPFDTVDPFGGVILSEWYSPPGNPASQFKVDVVLLDPQLRPDALRVSVFRRSQTPQGWVSEPVDPVVVRAVEDAILQQARLWKIRAEAA